MSNQTFNVITVKLKVKPIQKTKAWLLTFADNGKSDWFPYSTITSYNPATLEINIQKWILQQKEIKFKVIHGTNAKIT
jgi:hypothetical protein